MADLFGSLIQLLNYWALVTLVFFSVSSQPSPTLPICRPTTFFLPTASSRRHTLKWLRIHEYISKAENPDIFYCILFSIFGVA